MSEPVVHALGQVSPYAGFWRRFLAALIDTVILLIPTWIIMEFFGLSFETIAAMDDGSVHSSELILIGPFASFLLMVLYLLYYGLLESSNLQATPGKLALGIKVTNFHGERLSLLTAVVRAWPWYLGSAAGIIDGLMGLTMVQYMASLLVLISCVAVAFTAYKQGIHDILASCLVVKKDAVFGE